MSRDIPTFILSLRTPEREAMVQQALELFPNFKVFQAINGYDKEEVFKEFEKIGIKYTRIPNDPMHGSFNTFGTMANSLTKIKAMEFCLNNNYEYFAILEDDLQLSNIFDRFLKVARDAQLKEPREDTWFIRLGEWGEGYVFNKDGAIKTIEKLKQVGFRTQIDYELKYNGYPHISCPNTPWKLLVPTNQGDLLKTEMINDEEAERFISLVP
jgi:GR25 family glycosyltransferase involved in LPS biosynthesis